MTTREHPAETAMGCINGLRNGCILAFINLFFLGFLALIYYFGANSLNLARNGQSTEGVVVELDESTSGEGGTTYAPVFEFSVDGQPYRVRSGNSSDPPAYRVGQSVKVRYDPSGPQNAEIEDWLFWNSPLLFGGVFVILLIAAVVVNIVTIRRSMQGESIDDE